MKRTAPIVLAALLALATARVPAATAAAPTLSPQQTEEVVASYAHLTGDFYKKVDRQIALDEARASMVDYLKKKHVANPTLPALHATDDDAANAAVLQREVSTAVAAYAAKLEPVDSLSGSTQITYAAIAGLLNSVKDRYTVFLSPKEYAALNDNLDGTSFGGVGISYTLDDKTNALHVENVILDGPSDKAGLLAEDSITAIDGKPVATLLEGATTVELKQKRVTQALRGDPGTRVRLTIERNGKTLDPSR
ncbi:MAG: PDZ domain-containing protein [Candidatus Elarobacter sp.]